MKQQELSVGQHKLPLQQHMSSDSFISANSAGYLLPLLSHDYVSICNIIIT